MLVGAYPFEDQNDPKNFRKTINRIMSVQYRIPEYVHISNDCRELLQRIFVANPSKRITIRDIKTHKWFSKNLPRELTETAQAIYYQRNNNAPIYSLQSVDDIMKIVAEARTHPPASKSISAFGWAADEDDDDDDDHHHHQEEEKEKEKPQEEGEEEEDEYDKRVKEVQASGEFHVS